MNGFNINSDPPSEFFNCAAYDAKGEPEPVLYHYPRTKSSTINKEDREALMGAVIGGWVFLLVILLIVFSPIALFVLVAVAFLAVSVWVVLLNIRGIKEDKRRSADSLIEEIQAMKEVRHD